MKKGKDFVMTCGNPERVFFHIYVCVYMYIKTPVRPLTLKSNWKKNKIDRAPITLKLNRT